MDIILNFSHPLTESQKDSIMYVWGGFEEIKVNCQLDLTSKTLRDQVENLCVTSMFSLGNNQIVRGIIPPSLAPAAYWVGIFFSNLNIPCVWLRRNENNQFEIGGIE